MPESSTREEPGTPPSTATSAATKPISTYLEREVKLGIPAVFTLPVLIAAQPTNPASDVAEPASEPDHPVAAVFAGRRALRAKYHDTEDLRLARSGITLRHRTGEGKPTWTLKMPAASGIEGERVERSVTAPDGDIPSELLELVTAYVRFAPLVEVVKLTTRRDAWSLRDAADRPMAEVVDDLVSVIVDRKVVARFRELEIERATISDADLEDLVTRLEAAGAVKGTFQSKLVRALGPRATAPPDVPESVRIRRADPASAVLAQALRGSVRKLIAHDVGVRLGHDDAVHQMRVACRRMRSDLRTFATLLVPQPAEALSIELAWLADALGEARDLEVLRARLARTFAADPLSPLDAHAFSEVDAVLAGRETSAARTVAEALDSPRYVALLDRAIAYAREPLTKDEANRPARDVLPELVLVALADLDRKAIRLRKNAPDARWHSTRIRAKRARYAAEACIAAIGKRARITADAMAAVQDVLGDHQDAAVAAEAVLAIAAENRHNPPLVLLCGRLAERERQGVRVARNRFKKVWKVASGKGVRSWLPEQVDTTSYPDSTAPDPA